VGFDQYHEPPHELPAETRTFARMCASLTEEAEAIGWYEQRMAVERDADALGDARRRGEAATDARACGAKGRGLLRSARLAALGDEPRAYRATRVRPAEGRDRATPSCAAPDGMSVLLSGDVHATDGRAG
jgi:hypothetical protein